jgi:hypothetical protein
MIIGIAGAAGSGKDTVSGFISQYSNAISIAQADPMKRFARNVFDFTEQQLWGPSECRNAPDDRYDDDSRFWDFAADKLRDLGLTWVKEVLPDATSPEQFAAVTALNLWFNNMRNHHWVEKRQLTPRYMLQTIGTEWGRQFSSDMWNACALRAARTLLVGGHDYDRVVGVTKDSSQNGFDFVCVTDVRFRNELVGIHEAGGIVVNVQSPSENNAAVEAAGVKGHKSEAELKGIPKAWYDYVLVNNKKRGLLALENVVHSFCNELKASPREYTTEIIGPVDLLWKEHPIL